MADIPPIRFRHDNTFFPHKTERILLQPLQFCRLLWNLKMAITEQQFDVSSDVFLPRLLRSSPSPRAKRRKCGVIWSHLCEVNAHNQKTNCPARLQAGLIYYFTTQLYRTIADVDAELASSSCLCKHALPLF